MANWGSGTGIARASVMHGNATTGGEREEREQQDVVEDSTIELITGLASDARDLAGVHMRGLQLEVSKELKALSRATLAAAVSIALLSIGLLLLALASVYGVSAAWDLPLRQSYLIV